uniref:Rho GTPase-activating protein 29 n=1 Tax=Oncorhynchus tshawytscha TaxID=74940 RepID=A0AAZ3QCB2_ONCTS
MIRKSSSGTGGGEEEENNTKHQQNKPHCSSITSNMGRSSRTTNPLGSMGLGSNSLGLGSTVVGAPGVDPDYVMQLVNDVRRFSDMLLSLKEAFHSEESHERLPQRVQERLSELLRVLKSVIGKHQTLNSVDILRAAGTVITKVKGINFTEVNPEKKKVIFGEIYTSIDSLAFTFGNVVSDFLMGDVDSQSGLGIPQTRRSRVSQSGLTHQGCIRNVALSKEEEVAVILQKNDSGVESALLYAKAWSKYTKDLLAWVDKRLGLDIECAKSYAKMAESAKTLASQQDYMPFRDIYISTFKNDIEYSQLLLQTATALQTNKFIQPLLSRKTELDRLRKDLKEQWQREQKKMQESEAALRKARWTQVQRRDEYHKAQSSASRSQEEQSKQLDKKRKLEEEALQKAEDARDQYRSCVTDAGARRAELASTKTDILTQIRELVTQCDLTLKAVTVNWLQLQQAQTVPLPGHYQALCENAKMYEPGQRYAEFVRNLPKDQIHMESFSVDERLVDLYSLTYLGFVSNGIGKTSKTSGFHYRVPRMMFEEVFYFLLSGDFKRRLPRTPSTGTMSSADDLDERQPPSPSDNGLGEMVTETASSPGPFRNAQMSKASQTHKLRKLRAPSKCRECDSLVVFHGAECEECSLACHKKCLETLAIQCGHKKLQGRLQLFGIDFTQAAKNSPDGIPFIIRKCTSEIENRALNLKGIYRVNGAKSRVEKLCQAFENGKDLVELSDLSPHDIANVLKLYLRQLPEPLILYRYYNDFIGLAKERVEGEHIKLNRVIFKIRDLLRQLPPAHYRTLRFLTAHLHRVTEQAEENKMTASNLGIIFGPTLVKPRQTDAEVSLSSLVDYPYQALMVELLVRHFQVIFDLSSPSSYPPTTTSTVGQSSPRLTSQEKELSRHSTSLLDMKESAKVDKRHSSVIQSSQTLDDVREVKTDRTGPDRRELTAGSSSSAAGSSSSVQRSTLVFGRPSLNLSSSATAQKVQLRPQRARILSRPISMPLERLNSRNNNAAITLDPTANTIVESAEPEKPRIGGGSRVSTYYIDTQQAVQRRPWDRKYKHYDVTPRTAMIMANLPPDRPNSAAGGGGETRTSTNSPIKFRQPRILQPPPGTFYKPSGYSGARGWPSLSTSGTTSLTKMSPTSPTGKASSQTSPTGKASSQTSPTGKASSQTSPTVKTFSPTSPTVKTFSPTSPTVKTFSPTSPTVKTFPTSPTVKTFPSSPTVKNFPTSPTVTAPLPLSSSQSSSMTFSSSPMVTTTTTPSPTATYILQTPHLPTHTLQDSVDSSVSVDPEVTTSADLSPRQSPPPSSPEDPSPPEVVPLQQRLRPRPRPGARLQELEHREAHFV